LRDLLTVLALFVALFLLAAIVTRLDSEAIAGRAKIVDGDSIEIGATRIRLIGIDAPEYGQNCQKGGEVAACGRMARDHLRGLIAGRPVVCAGREHDRYDRLLAECRAGETELNAAMVRDGWAVDFGGYGAQEAEARRARRGLWATQFEMPSDWRANARLEWVGQERFNPLALLRQALTVFADCLTSWL